MVVERHGCIWMLKPGFATARGSARVDPHRIDEVLMQVLHFTRTTRGGRDWR